MVIRALEVRSPSCLSLNSAQLTADSQNARCWLLREFLTLNRLQKPTKPTGLVGSDCKYATLGYFKLSYLVLAHYDLIMDGLAGWIAGWLGAGLIGKIDDWVRDSGL